MLGCARLGPRWSQGFAARPSAIHHALPPRPFLLLTSRGCAASLGRLGSAGSLSRNPMREPAVFGVFARGLAQVIGYHIVAKPRALHAVPGMFTRGLVRMVGDHIVAKPLALLGRRIALAAAQLKVPQPPLEVPSWLLRTPLVGAALEHLRFRPTWPGHAAFALSGLSFLVTDILWLRGIASLSCVLAICFNWFHPVGKTLWLPVYWNVTYVLVNVAYICQLLSERIVVLSSEERLIYREHFDGAMSAADFRRLLRAGKVGSATHREQLLVRGQHPDSLVLVFDGTPEVEVEPGVTIVRENGLIGEMSFLHGGEASATVHVEPPCRYVKWRREDLDRLLDRDPELRRGIELAIARELMRKLVQSNRALVKATRESEYERFVAHTALRLQLHAAGALGAQPEGAEGEEKSGSCEPFFEVLRAHRQQAGVSESMHARVLAAFGVDEALSLREGASLESVCSSIVLAREGPRQPPSAEAHGGAAATATKDAVMLQRALSAGSNSNSNTRLRSRESVARIRADFWADSR